MKCHYCGKPTVVRTTGKGDEFLHRCGHCHGYHKFTIAGRHGSGAVNYRVTKVAPPPHGKSKTARVRHARRFIAP